MEKYTAWIGIDPGMYGGIAIQFNKRKAVAIAMPLGDDKNIDIRKLHDWLMLQLDYHLVFAAIERQGAMPGQGVSSTFKLGFGTGMLHGMLHTMNIPFEVVDSRKWKNRVLKGTLKDKQAAIDYSLSHFNYISLLRTPRSRTPHDGIADAICISEYARYFAGLKR